MAGWLARRFLLSRAIARIRINGRSHGQRNDFIENFDEKGRVRKINPVQSKEYLSVGSPSVYHPSHHNPPVPPGKEQGE